MEKAYSLRYTPSVWFKYINRSGIHYCQTDGLLFDDELKKVTILEVKYNHCVDAYFQLFDLYAPVVQCAFPSYKVATVEVVKWYDPSVAFPCAVRLRPSVEEVEPSEFAVHIAGPL